MNKQYSVPIEFVPSGPGGGGVTSVTGDGVFISNNDSTGAVTLTLENPITLPNGTLANTQSAFDSSTNIATTSYVDNEVGYTVSAPDFYGIPCEYWIFAAAASTTSQSTGTGNTYFVFFTLDRTVKFTKMSVNITIASNGAHINIGIYTKAMTSLLVQGNFTSGSGTGVLTASVSSTTLKPGTYCLAFYCDNATPARMAGVPQASNAGALINANQTRSGYINNIPSGGVMPANLLSSGTVTAGNTTIAPFVLLEP